MKAAIPANRMYKRIARTALIFILPVFIYNIAFRIYPIIYSLYLSFTKFSGLGTPKFVGMKNFQSLILDKEFWLSMLRTMQFSAEVLPANMLLSLLLALLINRKMFGISLVRSICYLPVITPMVAASVIWTWIYDPNVGILNFVLNLFGVGPVNFLGNMSTALHSIVMMRVWRGVGWNMIVYLAGLQSIPKEVYEAASIDGANSLEKFVRVTLPLLRPVHMYVLLVGLVSTLQTFTEVYVMTQGGPINSTTVVGLLIYKTAFDYMDMGYASAMSFVVGTIIMLASILAMSRRREVAM
ncbi:MAG TPA: sugar ABC transporter permease [Pseudothermotoga sp.]|nr:sugar ABC transporter permease [Pseudothermotoga sp.]HPP70349.1 sugar ABC transporter permease [Pseudothermotoga sp.]